MSATPVSASFFQFGLLLLFSLLFGSLVAAIGLPSVIGYLLAGVAMGPQGIGIVKDQTLITYISELGVLLLLFYMGLEISLKKFSRAGAYAVFLSPIKSGVGFALGFFVAKLLGLPTILAFTFGAALAVSSTAIISQIIIERHMEEALEAHIALAMLILEDVFSVFVIGYLLGAEGGVSVGKLLLNSAVILFVLFAIGTRLSRRLLQIFTKYGKPEHFSLYAFAILLVFAYGVSYLGMSPLLGAFFAGMVLSETVHAKRIEEELLSFRKLFVVIFFTALGLSYRISFGPMAVTLFIAGLVIMLVQRLVLFLSGPVFGLEPPKSARLSVLMLPLGEFSLFTAAAVQSIDFSRPEVLSYFGLTPADSAMIPTIASELMGATFLLIVVSTALAGIVFRREDAVESFLTRLIPADLIERVRRLPIYSSIFAGMQRSASSPAFALLVEKKTQRIIEYLMVIVAISYLMGYAATEYPHAALPIYLFGYLVSVVPLFGIVRAFYAIMAKYAEEFTRFSPFDRSFAGKLARSMAYVFVGILLFVFALVSLALAEGLNVLTFHLFSILLVAASVGLAGYGVYRLLGMFMVPMSASPSRTKRRVRSGHRKRV